MWEVFQTATVYYRRIYVTDEMKYCEKAFHSDMTNADLRRNEMIASLSYVALYKVYHYEVILDSMMNLIQSNDNSEILKDMRNKFYLINEYHYIEQRKITSLQMY